MNVHRPSRLLAFGTGTLTATLLLTVCGSAGAQTQTSTSTAVAKGTATVATAARSTVARCTTGELRATVQLQAAGSAMVILENKGGHTCTLFGYPGYRGLRADNRPEALAVKRAPHPGPPEKVTLKPGTAAFAGLKWSACQKSDRSCHVISGLQLTPPDETKQLTAKVLGLDGKPVTQLTVSAAGLTTGSLQPVSQGVVFRPGS
ncbi:DUF4232 domain-containing protein [Kitasatospora sp. NPDC053057]|uniref:DUF4232 domain-containing protein n=1 Tax=Kitasatospora sp. NPDC053057 TaxID=3364062 RepID=UPI0037C4F767